MKVLMRFSNCIPIGYSTTINTRVPEKIYFEQLKVQFKPVSNMYRNISHFPTHETQQMDGHP